MKVYVLAGLVLYEGYEAPVGVYATKEAADDACVKLNETDEFADYEVFEYELGA